MASENRDAHSCRSQPYGIVAHDLPCFVDHLHLFFCIAVFKNTVDMGKTVERYLIGIDIALNSA